MRLLLFAVLLLSAPVQSQNPAVANNHPSDPQPSQPSQPLAPSPDRTPQQDNHPSNRQGNTEGTPNSNTLYLILTATIAGASIFQAISAHKQGTTFEKQYKIMGDALIASNTSAEAAAKGVLALEKLERPFLMIELRGNPKHEVWVVNKGKIPAQIVWYVPEGSIRFSDRDKIDEMPIDFNYGFGYNEPKTEAINVPWIAPGGEMMVGNFQLIATDSETAAEIQNNRKAVIVLSAIKYRGMLTDIVFESRWCFRHWGSRRDLTYSGPYGYNSYT